VRVPRRSCVLLDAPLQQHAWPEPGSVVVAQADGIYARGFEPGPMPCGHWGASRVGRQTQDRARGVLSLQNTAFWGIWCPAKCGSRSVWCAAEFGIQRR
jgi:hypothetical protein